MPHVSDAQLTRLTASIGAQLDEIDARTGISASCVDLIRTALAAHHVVVMRDQFLTEQQFAAFAEAFGPILASPVQIATRSADASRGAVSTIVDSAERPPAGFPWHSDLSWTASPPRFGFLNAVTIPAYGGDTLWASTAAIFDALDPADRARCERSALHHAPDETLLASVARHHGAAIADGLRRAHQGFEHPMVGHDPVSGRKHLFLSPLYATHAVGPADGSLLADVHAMLDDPHVQLRWRWRAGDLVIWDEASTCHRALTDHYPQRRVMRRCVTGAW